MEKAVVWISIFGMFYVFTSAEVVTATLQVVGDGSQLTAEKLVNVTKYRTEKKPYGSPRCIQATYNFSKEYSYSETAAGSGKTAKCVFAVKNEENVSGNFTFYSQLLKPSGLTEGKDTVKEIGAHETESFEWNFTVNVGETAECLLLSNNYPHLKKCFFLEPITYEIKQVPYTVEELRNVTAESRVAVAVVDYYKNRFFGYKQPFYLGY